MKWGAKNAAEFGEDARFIIMDAARQHDFAQRLGVAKQSTIVIIKRYSNSVLQLKRISPGAEIGPSLTPLLWKVNFGT